MRLLGNDIEALLSQPAFRDWKRETIDLGGTSLAGATLRAHPTRSGFAVHWEGASESRFLTCFVDRDLPNGEAACLASLKSLIVDGHLDRVSFAGAPLRIGTRELFVPQSCERPTADRIRCSGAEIHWREPNLSCRVTAAETKAAFASMLGRVGKVTRETRPCVVLNERRVCEKYSIERKGEPPMTVIADIQDCWGTTVQCSISGAPGERFPAPCDQVFSGRP